MKGEITISFILFAFQVVSVTSMPIYSKISTRGVPFPRYPNPSNITQENTDYTLAAEATFQYERVGLRVFPLEERSDPELFNEHAPYLSKLFLARGAEQDLPDNKGRQRHIKLSARLDDKFYLGGTWTKKRKQTQMYYGTHLTGTDDYVLTLNPKRDDPDWGCGLTFIKAEGFMYSEPSLDKNTQPYAGFVTVGDKDILQLFKDQNQNSEVNFPGMWFVCARLAPKSADPRLVRDPYDYILRYRQEDSDSLPDFMNKNRCIYVQLVKVRHPHMYATPVRAGH